MNGASPPGRSFTERMLAAGGLNELHAGRGPSTQKIGIETKYHHYNPYYSACINMLIPGSEGDVM